MKKYLFTLVIYSLFMSANSQITIVLSGAGVNEVNLDSVYNEDFDGLDSPNSPSIYVDNTTVSGWYINSEHMDKNNDEYSISYGSSNSGRIYSYGSISSSERAMGYLGSGGNDYTNYFLHLVNNSGSTITSFEVGYTGEQWRSGGNTNDNNNKLEFYYQIVNAGGLTSLPTNQIDSTWINHTYLNFTPPQMNAAAGPLDGNDTTNQTIISSTISNISWNNGQELWIRIVGDDGSGTDAGIAIDDFSFKSIGGSTTTSCTTPTLVSTSASHSVTDSTVTISWQKGNGNNRILIITENNIINGSPIKDSLYIANSVYGSGDILKLGEYVVYNDSGSSITVTGLNPNTEYNFSIYEYNSSQGSVCYDSSSLTGMFTTSCYMLSDVTNQMASSGRDSESDISWANPNCFDEVLVFINTTSGIDMSPSADGSQYSADSIYSTFGQCVYKGSGSNITVTGLSKGVTYYFEIFTRIDTNWSTGVEVMSTPIKDLPITFISRYTDGREGSSEISAYDKASMRIFTTNSATDSLDIINVSCIDSPVLWKSVSISPYGGGINSVVNLGNGTIAMAIEDTVKQNNGKIVFIDTNGNYISDVTVGALPDMVTVTTDGSKVLVANEGEPNDDYTVDPEGSISIIDISGGVTSLNQSNVTTLDFLNAPTDISGSIKKPGISWSEDLEPEYIAVNDNSTIASVICQESNVMILVDLVSDTIMSYVGLGFKDHSLSGNGMDVSDKDNLSQINTWNVKGVYQPDGISSINIGGNTYWLTANEGDGRDYKGYSSEIRVKDLNLNSSFPTNIQDNDQLGRLKTFTADVIGDTNNDGTVDEIYSYGARSFSIWDETGSLVYDSKGDIEKFFLDNYPSFFNCNDGSASYKDKRSDDKGIEPEAITVGEIDGTPYCFVGLERQSAIMVYDISDPANPIFLKVIETYDVSNGTMVDIGPEGLMFISSDNSHTGNNLLIVSNEVSGTTTVYQLGEYINTKPVISQVIDTTNENTPITFCPTVRDINKSDTLTVSVSESPINGVVSVDSNCITYIPTSSFTGLDSVSITACDQGGICDTNVAYITVMPLDSPPKISQMNITVYKDSFTAFCPIISDFNTDDTLTVSICGSPNNGNTLVDSNCITYTPDSNYLGLDTLCIKVCDNGGLCDSINVGIMVIEAPYAPVITQSDIVLNEDENISFCPSIFDNNSGDKLSVSICKNAINGTTSIDTNCITYVPNKNFNGFDSICIKVCDNGGLCDSTYVNIKVNPVNDNPTISQNNLRLYRDSFIKFCPEINDIDGDTPSITLCSNPTNGSALIGKDNCVTYSPNSGFYGSDSVCVKVCDNGGLCDSTIIGFKVDTIVIPPNDAPVITQGDIVIFQNSDTIFCPTISDPNNDNMIMSICKNPFLGSSVLKDNCIKYIVTTNATGDDRICIRVCDDRGLCSEKIVNIKILIANSSIIDDANNIRVTVAPNPITRSFNILFNENYNNYKYIIYDITGIEILKGDVNSKVINIDSKLWSRGIYYLSILENDNLVVKNIKIFK